MNIQQHREILGYCGNADHRALVYDRITALSKTTKHHTIEVDDLAKEEYAIYYFDAGVNGLRRL